jgi:meiotic recombination protein SPO11
MVLSTSHLQQSFVQVRKNPCLRTCLHVMDLDDEITPAPQRASTGSAVRSGRVQKKPRAPPKPKTPAKRKPALTDVLGPVRRLGTATLALGLKTARDLSALGIGGLLREVLEMDANAVRRGVERVLTAAAKTIVAGEGFRFVVPTRSASNQMYVEELDRIVLKDKVSQRVFANTATVRKTAITTRVLGIVWELCRKGIHITKRDMFYTDVKLFKSQVESDDVLNDVACLLGCTRTSLSVVGSEKGCVIGCVSFREDGDLIDCMRMGVGGKAIPPYIDRISEIKSTALFVLLVEKDAAFMRLAEDRFYRKYPCIIITAKGQPDVATRLFLKKLRTVLNIPILGLVDSDPYGLKILSVYMSGSKNMSYDSANLTTPDIKWLGVWPSDLDRYDIPAQCRLPLTEYDIKTGKELLDEDFIKKNSEWHHELELMVQRKEKAEIQALSTFGFQFLTEEYLPNKLRDGAWI